jgi:hypothetical protein
MTMKLGVRLAPNTKPVLKLVHQWPERIEAIIKTFPQMVAQDTLVQIQGRAPKGIEGYPEMLRVLDIPAMAGWELTAILPPGWAFSQRLRQVDVKRTVLYVRPKVVGGEVVDEGAVVLERLNPWTLDTLPYEPSRKAASIISRRVTEREARPIEFEKRRELPRVKEELRALGITLRPKGKVTLSRRVTRDLAFEVLRHEFGIPPVPGRAHWKPAIRMVPTTITKRQMKELFKWFAYPSNEQYKSASDLPYEKRSVIKRIQRFQDLVGMGGG